jgi:HD superfamily phosphohydrolase
MVTGRIPVVVIGSGLSAGVGAPTMGIIHRYLRRVLEGGTADPKVATIIGLLDLLTSDVESPRSVQVRLYHLLQTSAYADIRRGWASFGESLLAGTLEHGGAPRPLHELRPSAGHIWAARLAIERKAMIVSLNYDGLTSKAVVEEAHRQDPSRSHVHKARILSSAREIRGYFGREEAPDSSEVPVPIIKFRGDIFHAVCRNGRCPEHRKPHPLYVLLDDSGRDLGLRASDGKEASGPHPSLLTCRSCGQTMQLSISFPGVFRKEREIERALSALHEVIGSRIAGVVFLGFSGKWDEGLVEYLVARAARLDAPVLSFSKDPTPAIALLSSQRQARYWHVPYESREGFRDEELEHLINASELARPLPSAVLHRNAQVQFPSLAIAPESEVSISMADGVLTVRPAATEDGFTQIADTALETTELKRLERCSQLGTKVHFLQEPKHAEHTRLHHSARAGLNAMIWYDALLSERGGSTSWHWSEDARLALHLAVLFHDARHLPFSHMMEEILRELNWGQYPTSAWPQIPQWTDVVNPVRPENAAFVSALATAVSSASGESAASPLPLADLTKWWLRVRALQEGTSGSTWLEAIVDSALDVDKIEYIFRDSDLSGQNVRLSSQGAWLETFLAHQRLTPEGTLCIEGDSCFAALALLQERMHLYQNLYLLPALRGLEAMVRYIVLTWLEWEVSAKLDVKPDHSFKTSDLRPDKARLAGRLLWELFDGNSPPMHELASVGMMVESLASGPLDPAALEWLKHLWQHLRRFTETPSAAPAHASLSLAHRVFAEMAPIGPLYVHQAHEDAIRQIARHWRVHYPLTAIIDIASFPRFLSTPRNRLEPVLGRRATVAEHFLVPGVHPSQWRRSQRATVPLHRCSFRAFETPALQVIILDPGGTASGGSSFVYDMFLRDLRSRNIEWYENAELVPK